MGQERTHSFFLQWWFSQLLWCYTHTNRCSLFSFSWQLITSMALCQSFSYMYCALSRPLSLSPCLFILVSLLISTATLLTVSPICLSFLSDFVVFFLSLSLSFCVYVSPPQTFAHNYFSGNTCSNFTIAVMFLMPATANKDPAGFRSESIKTPGWAPHQHMSLY